VKQKEQRGYVYLLRNLKTGDGYVGKHRGTHVERRLSAHISVALSGASTYPIHRAIRKAYHESKGASLGFSAEVIWEGAPDDALIFKMERKFIKELGTFARDGKGYNLTFGGDGVTMTPEVVKKIGAAVSAAWKRPEVRAKFEATNAAMRVKVSTAHKERLKDPAEREKLRQINLARYEDPLEHELSAVRAKKFWSRPETRAKKVLANQERWLRPGERDKASETAVRRWARQGEKERSAVWIEKTAAFNRGKKDSDATKLKKSEARQVYLERRRLQLYADVHPWRLLGLDNTLCQVMRAYV